MNYQFHTTTSSADHTPCKETGSCFLSPASWPLPLLPAKKTITDMVQEVSTASPALMNPDCLTKIPCL